MSHIKLLCLILIPIQVIQASLSENQHYYSEPFPEHWYEVKTIDGEEVIFIPCDYQNTEFIFESVNGQNKLIEVTGQDGWEDTIEEVVSINNKTTLVSVLRPDKQKITFHVTEISDHISNWKWEEVGYDGKSHEYSINMAPEAFKDKFKVVKEPPCM